MKFENDEFHSSLRVVECQGEVMSVGNSMCADEERSAFPPVGPSCPKSPLPRPSPQGTPEALLSPILRACPGRALPRDALLPAAALHVAPSRSRQPVAGGAHRTRRGFCVRHTVTGIVV